MKYGRGPQIFENGRQPQFSELNEILKDIKIKFYILSKNYWKFGHSRKLSPQKATISNMRGLTF